MHLPLGFKTSSPDKLYSTSLITPGWSKDCTRETSLASNRLNLVRLIDSTWCRLMIFMAW